MKRAVLVALALVACEGKNELGGTKAGAVVLDWAVTNGSARPEGPPVVTTVAVPTEAAGTLRFEVTTTRATAAAGGGFTRVRAVLRDTTKYAVTAKTCELPPAPIPATFLICHIGLTFEEGNTGSIAHAFFDVCLEDGRAMVADRGPAEATPCKK